MKLNQTTAYAIAATAHIAAQPAGSLIPNSKICAATQMPERYILQLLRSLVNAGVLTSVRGVMGGYKLAKPANKITLLEIVEAIDGPIGQQDRVEMPPLPGRFTSSIDGAFAAIESDIRKRLASVTLADASRAKAA